LGQKLLVGVGESLVVILLAHLGDGKPTEHASELASNAKPVELLKINCPELWMFIILNP
jgi:hypothetical protein